jgi:hypothetical protein
LVGTIAKEAGKSVFACDPSFSAVGWTIYAFCEKNIQNSSIDTDASGNKQKNIENKHNDVVEIKNRIRGAFLEAANAYVAAERMPEGIDSFLDNDTHEGLEKALIHSILVMDTVRMGRVLSLARRKKAIPARLQVCSL